jgi:hypothetical protein
LQGVFEFNADQVEWGIGKVLSRMQTLRLDSDHSFSQNVLSCRRMIRGEVTDLCRLVHIRMKRLYLSVAEVLATKTAFAQSAC